MSTPTFIIALKSQVTLQTLPWLLIALKQEPLVWDCLMSQDFGPRLLAAQSAPEADWSPANLALLALEIPISRQSLCSEPLQILPHPYLDQAAQAYRGWESQPPAFPASLRQSGLLALWLSEQRRQRGDWQHLALLLETRAEVLRPVLACLYGMTPDPFALLRFLVRPGEESFYPALALHALLSTPSPPSDQIIILQALFDDLPPASQLSLLRCLAAQRPSLAAQIVLEAPDSTPTEDEPLLERIERLQQSSEGWHLARQSHQAIPLLAEALLAARQLQATLSCRLAQAAHQAGETHTELEAWKQAVQMMPDSPVYSGRLALALLEAGQPGEAQLFLSARRGGEPRPPTPALMLAHALLSSEEGEEERAIRAARQALSWLESGRPQHLTPEDELALAVPLARFFLKAGLPQEAIQTVDFSLKQCPGDSSLLALLAQAWLDLENPTEAIQAAYRALALAPGNLQVLRLAAQSLEAAGEWLSALDEREALLERTESPGVEDLNALANCMLRAGQPERSRLACRQALELDPNDGQAYRLLGEADLALGDRQQALAHFQQATLVAPQDPSTWLALANAYQQVGQRTKAVEVLRAASRATPNSARLHLALGEACLEQNSPTQALAALRRAATLAAAPSAQEKNLPLSKTDQLSGQIALPLGRTLHQLGRYEEARQVLEEAYQAASSPGIAHAYAQSLLALHDLQPAITVLKTVIQARPADPAPYLELGRAILQLPCQSQTEIASGISALQHCIQIAQPESPAREEAQILLAEAFASAGDNPLAFQAYQQALETRLSQTAPWRGKLVLGLGQVSLALGQFETARAMLHEAVQANPRSFQAQRSLSEACLALGLLEDAFQSARLALQLEPAKLDVLSWFATQAWQIHTLAGNSMLPAQFAAQPAKEALDALRHAIQLAPNQPDLLLRYGKIQMQNGDRLAALETFRLILSSVEEISGNTPGCTTEDSIPILQQAAQHLNTLGDLEHSAACLEKAILLGQGLAAQCHSAGLLAELATTHRQAGKYQSALEALDQALALEPNDPALYRTKAEVLLALERTGPALDCLQESLRFSPADGETHYHLAHMLRLTGDLPAALAQAEQAIAAPWTALGQLVARCLSAELSRSMLLPHWGDALLADVYPEGQPPDSRHQLISTWLSIEWLLEEHKEAGAGTALAYAVELAPQHPRTLAAQARLATRRGDHATALKTLVTGLEALRRLKPGPSEGLSSTPGQPAYPVDAAIVAAQRALGLAALELERWEDAIRLFQQIVEKARLEPLAHLQLAQALVLRAEAQHRCQALEVVRRSPGLSALETDARQCFEDSIRAINQITSAWNEPPPHYVITRWSTRGQAVFQPGPASLRVLEGACTGPADVAALVMALGRAGEYEKAARATQGHPRHDWVLMHLALALQSVDPSQAYQAAQSAWECHLEKGQGRPSQEAMLQFLLARLHFLTAGAAPAQRETALQILQAALATWPDEPRWHLLAAEICLAGESLADKSAAIAHLEEAARLEPRSISHYLALGQVYMQTGENLRSVNILEQACRISPEDPASWLALASAQRAAGELDRAGASAERAMECSPNDVNPLLLRGEIALQANNPHGAVSRARAALRIKANEPAALHLLARALAALDRPSEALTALEKAIPQAEQPLPLLLERTRLLRRAKGPSDALQSVRQLVERFPDEPAVQASLAEALLEAGQAEPAIQAARCALQSGNGHLSEAEKASLHYLIGRQLRRNGQLDQCIHHLNEAVKQAPERLETYLELGSVLQDRRQHTQALKVYQQAIEVAQGDHRPFYQAGLALKESKDYLGAEEMLRQAAQLAPDDLSIHRMLGAVVALNLVHNRRQPKSRVA